MKGHQPLIAMRANRTRPKAVFLCDSDSSFIRKACADWWRQRNESDNAWHVHIRIEEGDNPALLDFRYLNGLTVHVQSDRSAARFNAIFAAAVQAGAIQVNGVHEGAVYSETKKDNAA